MYGLKLIIAIVPRGKGEDVAALCRENGLTFSMISPAYGAGGTHFIDYLGLTNPEKDCILSVVQAEFAHEMLNRLHDAISMDEVNTGIAMTIPITAVSGPRALRWISGVYPPPSDSGWADGSEPSGQFSSSGASGQVNPSEASGQAYGQMNPSAASGQAHGQVSPSEASGAVAAGKADIKKGFNTGAEPCAAGKSHPPQSELWKRRENNE